ncbi:MAG: hypothetical protein WA137_07880 [Methanothrix sp.]
MSLALCYLRAVDLLHAKEYAMRFLAADPGKPHSAGTAVDGYQGAARAASRRRARMLAIFALGNPTS